VQTYLDKIFQIDLKASLLEMCCIGASMVTCKLGLAQLCPTQMTYWAKKSCHYLNLGRTFHDILMRAAQ